MEIIQKMDYKAEVHKAGRITIPIEVRKQFQIAEGDVLTIRQEDGELKNYHRSTSFGSCS